MQSFKQFLLEGYIKVTSNEMKQIEEIVRKFEKRRNLDICVISDVHLGSYGCHAEELNNYIKSIKPTGNILVRCTL